MLPNQPSRSNSEEYDKLPQAIKDRFTLEQYLWLPNWIKRDLVQTETEPECE